MLSSFVKNVLLFCGVIDLFGYVFRKKRTNCIFLFKF